ncbi:MAG: hypothetical protein ABIK28_18290 [Planctomycetota bacterium]
MNSPGELRGISPCVIDWNGDGRKDLLAGDCKGDVWFFRNAGTRQAPALEGGIKIRGK